MAKSAQPQLDEMNKSKGAVIMTVPFLIAADHPNHVRISGRLNAIQIFSPNTELIVARTILTPQSRYAIIPL